MKLSDAELEEFRARCLRASYDHQEIGRAEVYLEALTNEVRVDTPKGMRPGSAEHLYYLACQVLAARREQRPVQVISEPELESSPLLIFNFNEASTGTTPRESVMGPSPIGTSTLEGVFDELGERAEFDELLQKKHDPDLEDTDPINPPPKIEPVKASKPKTKPKAKKPSK